VVDDHVLGHAGVSESDTERINGEGAIDGKNIEQDIYKVDKKQHSTSPDEEGEEDWNKVLSVFGN
jgi:hypothetical protein